MGERDDARHQVEQKRERMSRIAHEVSRRMTPGYAKERAREMARDRMSSARDRAVEHRVVRSAAGGRESGPSWRRRCSRGRRSACGARSLRTAGTSSARTATAYPPGASGYAAGHEDYVAYGGGRGCPEEAFVGGEPGGATKPGIGEKTSREVASEVKERARANGGAGEGAHPGGDLVDEGAPSGPRAAPGEHARGHRPVGPRRNGARRAVRLRAPGDAAGARDARARAAQGARARGAGKDKASRRAPRRWRRRPRRSGPAASSGRSRGRPAGRRRSRRRQSIDVKRGLPGDARPRGCTSSGGRWGPAPRSSRVAGESGAYAPLLGAAPRGPRAGGRLPLPERDGHRARRLERVVDLAAARRTRAAPPARPRRAKCSRDRSARRCGPAGSRPAWTPPRPGWRSPPTRSRARAGTAGRSGRGRRRAPRAACHPGSPRPPAGPSTNP